MATIVEAPGRAGTTPAWTSPVRLTALHRTHLARGATLVERDGWLLPASYGDDVAEEAALREAVGLSDIGDSGKIDLKSDDLDAALSAAFPGLGRIEVGTAVPDAPAAARGRKKAAGVEGITRVYRLAEGQALVLTAPAAVQAAVEALGQAASAVPCTHVVDLTGALCGLRLHGPKAPALLERLATCDLAPDRFADGAVAQCGLAHVHAIVARRDADGTTGYDLYVDRDLGAYLWDTLMEQGAPLGIAPVGREVVSDE